MATNQMSGVIQHFRRVLEGPGLTDTQLLEDYINRHDEAAFAALVRRHGPMVWGVCRRVLCNHHAAEDAFQATFLVLVRKAASIASRELLANWLYGVAHQTALKARMTATKRIGRERQVAAMSESAVTQQDQWGDLQLLLDEELSRLPSKYRGVIVLCDLEGKTRKEVAQQLGCPEGTVASRLVRARTMLAKRLTRRGVTLSGGALATALSQQAVSAGVPNSVVASTIKAASMKAVATGTISVKVAALTEQVMKAMLLTKLKTALAVLLVLGFVATEITILTCSTAAGREDKQSIAEKVVEPAAKKENAKEIVTAWGKEIGGLQAGLGFRPGQNRAYQHGETVTLVVRVRNVSKEKIDFQYLRHFFIENPPVVVDDKGKPVPLKDGSARGIYKPLDVSLAPGKETELYELELELSNNLGVGVPRDSTLHGTGKFSIQYERILGNSFLTSVAIKFDPILSKLATGKLELEVKKAEKAPDKKGDKKELVTAWGKEIGGLQAGLGFHPGEHRAYQHGETATVIVRVRNVGKEVVEFKYIWAFFFENPPTITDADGKLVQLPKGSAEGRHVPRSINVPPGKEVELFAWRFDLKKHPLLIEPESLVSSPIHGTGKFTVQCERIVGPTSANPDDPNPALSKLATGKLELEVKEAKKVPDTFTAWGKEVGGVQAGLGYLPGQHRAYSQGETVKLVVRVRNVGKNGVKFQYFRECFYEGPPAVTDGDGKLLHFKGVGFTGERKLVEVDLKPGKEIELCQLNLELRPDSERGKDRPWSLYQTGKFQFQFERIGGNIGTGEIRLDPILSKLATGKLELEVK